jgi:BirA family biotin operon repressor/biotin-[acetyl-CoA-carboxylase] ligase
MSILLRQSMDGGAGNFLTVLVALSARAALVRLSGLRPELKWPNDLMVGERKLGGVLAELVTDRDGTTAQVVGLGVNLTYPGPEGVASTCVSDEVGITLEPRSLCDIVIDEVDRRLDLLTERDHVTLRTEYVLALGTLGRRVQVEGPGGQLEGEAQWIDRDGRLGVVTDEGGRHIFDVGDVTHVRTLPSLD